MTDTSTIPPQEPVLKEEITLDSIAHRLDMLGEQLNWLCENLAGVFGVVSSIGQQGGGVRGLMKVMRDAPGMIDATVTNGEPQ